MYSCVLAKDMYFYTTHYEKNNAPSQSFLVPRRRTKETAIYIL